MSATARELGLRMRPWPELAWFYALKPGWKSAMRVGPHGFHSAVLRSAVIPPEEVLSVRGARSGWIDDLPVDLVELCAYPSVYIVESVIGAQGSSYASAAPWVPPILRATQWLPTEPRRIAWAMQRWTSAEERTHIPALEDIGGTAAVATFLLSRPELCAGMVSPLRLNGGGLPNILATLNSRARRESDG